MHISNRTLVKIAAIGGIATVTMGFLARNRMQYNIRSTPFYKEAMTLVRKHPAAVHLLGEPIKEGNIDIGKTYLNFVEGDVAKFEVPLKGSKQKGLLYLMARKSEGDELWTLCQIELTTKNEPDKRLIIKQLLKDSL